MTIITFADKMKKAGWNPSGGWKPEDLAAIPQEYDAEFADKNKILFVKSSTFLAMEAKEFTTWIQRTERIVYKSAILQIF